MAILALLYCSIRHSRESGNPGGQGRGGCSWTSAETLVTSSRRELTWPTAGDMRNVGFTEFCRLVEAFGSTLRRVSGSHHIYRHPDVPRPLSLQPHQRENGTPPMTAKYHINLFWSEPDGAWVADVPDLHAILLGLRRQPRSSASRGREGDGGLAPGRTRGQAADPGTRYHVAKRAASG
jgi:predicted RNA binding protein YcfA (HicA-like mRNA interferase family)